MSAESESSSNVMAEAMNGDGATPLVSVIVPVYGVERYLDACVEGLVGQTYAILRSCSSTTGRPTAALRCAMRGRRGMSGSA